MSVDDILFAPILPSSVEDQLRDIIRKVMTAPKSNDYTDQVTGEIVELLQQHGFTDDQEIANIVRRVIKELHPFGTDC